MDYNLNNNLIITKTNNGTSNHLMEKKVIKFMIFYEKVLTLKLKNILLSHNFTQLKFLIRVLRFK